MGENEAGDGEAEPSCQGRDCGGVSCIHSKAMSFRKGWDDGDRRLGWRGNSGTSRHQPLLSVATHILFLSTTLSWGQWSLNVLPERDTGSYYHNPLIDRPKEESASRIIQGRREGRDPSLHGILPVHLGSSMNESGRMSPRGQFGGAGALKSECWWPATVKGSEWEGMLEARDKGTAISSGRDAVGPPL